MTPPSPTKTRADIRLQLLLEEIVILADMILIMQFDNWIKWVFVVKLVLDFVSFIFLILKYIKS